jgi:hypothetical protein
VWSAPVRTGDTFSVGEPVRLFDATFDRGLLALAPDGRRFAAGQPLPAAALTQIHVVLNWAGELGQSGTGR